MHGVVLKAGIALCFIFSYVSLAEESMHGDKDGKIRIGTDVLTPANDDGLPTPSKGL